MDKFKKAKDNFKKLTNESDLFADTVDKIARERAIKSLLDGEKSLSVNSMYDLKNQIDAELEVQYSLIQSNEGREEIERFYTGFKILHAYWIKRDEIDVKLEDLLGNPTSYIDFDEFTTGLVADRSLEKTIKALSVSISEFERMMQND